MGGNVLEARPSRKKSGFLLAMEGVRGMCRMSNICLSH